MNDSLLDSVEKSLNKSIDDFRKEQNETKKQEAEKKAKEAEAYFFALKITQPAQVKNILRIKPNPDLEEKLIKKFIAYPLADPTKYTMVMEGRPFVAVIEMDNGLKYRAAMTRLIHIKWPKDISQMPIANQKLLTDKQMECSDRPTIYADQIEYALLLWPIHKGNKIKDHDHIDVRWNENQDIVTLQEKEGKDAGDGIHTVGGIHLSGTAVCTGSFRLLNSLWGIREKYPRHFHQLFGAIQKAYDFAHQKKSLGKAIYALLDKNKPARGFGWTIPILPAERGYYFEVPEIKVVNPNQPLKIVHKKTVPTPQRIKIDIPTQLLERINMYE